jgi:predicted neuraminidase
MMQLTPKAMRWLSAMLFIAALTAAFWRIPTPPASAFEPPPAPSTSQHPVQFTAEFLPKAAESAHAASLAQLPDGRIAAAWFAGSKEGADDVAIWFSLRDKDGWRTAQPIANRESTAGGTFAHVRKIGNPILFVEGSWLHLWYVSVAVGGWAGSSINHSVSTDAGTSWFKPTKLQTSPFASISTLVRSQPIPLADGGLGLPVYHEFIAKHGEWLRLSATGQGPGKVRVTSTQDAGQTWQAGMALPIPNPNSSVALLRLKSGRLLLAGNPQNGREAILLWVSADEGKTWQASRTVETAPDGGAEFSYPALLLDRDGLIHIAYTWRRQGIKHAAFSEAWLDEIKP